MKHCVSTFLFAFAAMLISQLLLAGPPFLTDDPEPVDLKHWEFYLFGVMDKASDGKSGLFPAMELNYGAAPNLQLHVIVPLAFASPSQGLSHAGFGDVELGFKFRFLEETESRPQIAIFPTVVLPTGSESRGLGNGGLLIQLPIWIQKSWGVWTTYGGAGYAFNRAPGGRSYPYGGWLLQRDFGSRLTLGAEIFKQGRTAEASAGTTICNAGGQIDFTHHVSLLFSAGRSVAGARHRVAYLALYVTWGPRGL